MSTECYFKWNGNWKHGRIVATYNFKGVKRCEDDKGAEYLMAPDDVLDLPGFEKLKQVQAVDRWRDVYEIYQKGEWSPSKMMETLPVIPAYDSPRKVSYAIRRLKEVGAIQ